MPTFFADPNAEGPDYMPDARDYVFINGTQTPGIASVKCMPKNLLDIKKPHGSDGARVVEKGYEPARVTVLFTWWTQSQETKLFDLIETFYRRPGKDSKDEKKKAKNDKTPPDRPGIQFLHPATVRFHIDRLMVEGFEGIEQAKEYGAWTLRMNAVQLFEPKGDQTKVIKGAGHTLTTKGQAIKNAVNIDPSKTDGVPKVPAKPAAGAY